MRIAKPTLIAFVALAAAVGWRVNGQTIGANRSGPETFTRLTGQDIKLLLEDLGEVNPTVVERLKEDSDLRKAQVENLRELLALASEAEKTGLADGKEHRSELEYIRLETIALSYDRHVHKPKLFDYQSPFRSISAEAVANYWGESPGTAIPAKLKAARDAKFKQFLNTKFYLLKAEYPSTGNKEPSAGEIVAARELYAKINISVDAYKKRALLLPLSLRQKISLQIKLQQAQFLARLYREKVVAQITASDEEIANYIKHHPDLDTAGQRAKAEKILARAKSGEDFARLANEFTEDPGNKNQQGELQGGLYQNVNTGVMVAPFERAALALEPGQVGSALVETDFGFHIVKLERKSSTQPETYDVRHILIATGIGDPSNPTARTVPVNAFVRREIEREKEQRLIDQLIATNKISVPDDFEVPTMTVKPEESKGTPKAKARPARKRT